MDGGSATGFAGAGLRVGVLTGNCEAQDFGGKADVVLERMAGGLGG